MKKLILYTGFLFFPGFLSAQNSIELSLEKYRQMALESSKTIKIAELQQVKVKGEKTAARSAWFPKAEASAMGIYSKQQIQQELMLPTKTFDMASGELVPNIAVNPMTGAPNTTPDGTPVFNTYAFLPLDLTLYGGYMASISLNQPIYTGGRIIAGNKMADIAGEMAQTNRELKEDELIHEANSLYFNYLALQEKLKLAKTYQSLLQAVVKNVNDAYETGMVNKNELLKTQVKLNEASLQLQQAESGSRLMGMALCKMIGTDLYSEIILSDSLMQYSSPQVVPNNQVQNRSEYKLLSNQLEMAHQEVKLQQGNYLPTLGVSAGYNYFSAILKDMNDYSSDGFNVIASLKIPLVSFGERKGKIASARASENIKRLELQETGNLLVMQMEQARLNYRDAYVRVQMAEEAMKQAGENSRVSDDLYRLGMETLVNLLEAKTVWQKAYSEKIDAIASFKIAESLLQKVSK